MAGSAWGKIHRQSADASLFSPGTSTSPPSSFQITGRAELQQEAPAFITHSLRLFARPLSP